MDYSHNVSWKQIIQLQTVFESVRVQGSRSSVKMERGERRRWPSWKNLKQRLGLKRFNIMSLCGTSNWILHENAGEEPLITSGDQSPAVLEMINPPTGSSVGQVPAGGATTTMNLATALAADRRQLNVGPTEGMKTKPLKSIVRLFEGIDGRDVKVAEDDDDGSGGRGMGSLCCLCTERNKGAALIPCGHTYCRVCSRAMWSKRGSCPLCNRSITEILEIF